MADVNFVRRTTGKSPAATQDGVARDEGALFELIELLFFAYRDFIGDPDAILHDIGFGRAHHRVLHFVNRNPGLTGRRPARHPEDHQAEPRPGAEAAGGRGLHRAAAGPADRRQRLLYPTQRGRELALELASPQFRRLAAAIADADPGDAEAAKRFLMHVVNEPDRSASPP